MKNAAAYFGVDYKFDRSLVVIKVKLRPKKEFSSKKIKKLNFSESLIAEQSQT